MEVKPPGTKYDFVGHITYPDDEKIQNLFFYENKRKCVDVVERDGVVISESYIETKFVTFLQDHGYTVTRKQVTPNKVRSAPKVLVIECENEECPYHNEIRGGKCRIKVKAMVEVIIKAKRKNPGLKKILLAYRTRDMKETTIKTDCIINYVKERTDIEGEPDTYSKMELC